MVWCGINVNHSFSTFKTQTSKNYIIDYLEKANIVSDEDVFLSILITSVIGSIVEHDFRMQEFDHLFVSEGSKELNNSRVNHSPSKPYSL